MDSCCSFPVLWMEGIPAGNSDVNRMEKDLGRQLAFSLIFFKMARAQWKGSRLHFTSAESTDGQEGKLRGETGRA